MEGKVTVNGELRLKHGIVEKDNITTTNDDSNSKNGARECFEVGNISSW